MVDFARFMGAETRGRCLNPKWIGGMKEHGCSGALKMSDFLENLWGWQVTTPKEVMREMWQQVNEFYVNDNYGMELKELFEKKSPYAYQAIATRIMEVERKGYQKSDKEVLEKLAREYVESVAAKGFACCEHTCNNIALNQFAANIRSVFGIVSSATMVAFQKQVKVTTGKDVENPDWVKEADRKAEQMGTGPDKSAKPAESGKMEQVKGYEMQEEDKDEPASDLSATSTSLMAVLIVAAVVAIIGRGLWKGMKQQR